MPYCTFSGIDKYILLEVKDELVETLSTTFNCPKDHLVIKCESTEEIYNVYPFVEIKMFRRPKDVMDNVVKVIVDIFKRYGITYIDSAFTYYEASSYYVNTESLG